MFKKQQVKFFSYILSHQSKNINDSKPINISITGAAGNIGYAIAFRIAAGDLFGPNQLINLNLIDIPVCENKLTGVKLELDDCSFKTLNEVKIHTSLSTGFKDADAAFLIGVANTVKGGERKDGLIANAIILKENGKAINENASRHVRVLTVGNPVNTNTLIALKNAPNISPFNFHALSRLDHNRAIHKLSEIFKVHVSKVEKVFIWGNHDATMYPELEYGRIEGRLIKELINEKFIHEEFADFVANRWKEIIHYRCLTSCASAASSALDHMRDWFLGTNGNIISMGLYTDKNVNTKYGIPEGLIFSLPCVVDKQGVRVIDNFILNEFTKEKLKITTNSLLDEKKIIESYL